MAFASNCGKRFLTGKVPPLKGRYSRRQVQKETDNIFYKKDIFDYQLDAFSIVVVSVGQKHFLHGRKTFLSGRKPTLIRSIEWPINAIHVGIILFKIHGLFSVYDLYVSVLFAGLNSTQA